MDQLASTAAQSGQAREGSGGEALRLVVFDPHHLFGECLARALARDRRFKVVAQAASGGETLETLAGCAPNVLLIGIDVLDEELMDLLRSTASLFPAVRILILGRAEPEEKVAECLRAGAGGYLLRDQSLAEVEAAIEAVAGGGTVCSPRVMRLLFSRLGDLGRERRRRERLDRLELSAREMEILGHIADGLTNQEIARRLCLSVHTVKNHVHRILEVLGVNSRWGAVNHAFAKGWLQDRHRGAVKLF